MAKNKSSKVVLGIDIGGTGIKGALVDTKKGALASERHRVLTPQPATPQAVAETVAGVVDHFRWQGRLGCTVPARVRRGVVETASNIEPEWIGTDAEDLFRRHTGLRCRVVNDADAAGLAEVRFGAGKGVEGTVLLLTLGTGIGSALFYDGSLVPNTEFGHLELDGIILEHRASNLVRKQEELPWEAWAGRVQEVLEHVEFVLAPDLLIIGGGVSRPHRWAEFGHLLRTQAPLVPAHFAGESGILGAAWHARKSKEAKG